MDWQHALLFNNWHHALLFNNWHHALLSGTELKKQLTFSQFIVEFNYGVILVIQPHVLQMEDCIGILKFLYPQYDVLFLFNHSYGHDKQHKDELNVEIMLKKCWKTKSFYLPQ